MNATQIKARVADIVFKNSPEISLLLSIAATVAGIGFIFGVANTNYSALIDLMPLHGWALLFLVYGISKCYLVISNKTPTRWDILNSAVGVWAWNYIFLSFTLFDTEKLTPLELLLALPTLAEAWALTSIIYNKNCAEDT